MRPVCSPSYQFCHFEIMYIIPPFPTEALKHIRSKNGPNEPIKQLRYKRWQLITHSIKFSTEVIKINCFKVSFLVVPIQIKSFSAKCDHRRCSEDR